MILVRILAAIWAAYKFIVRAFDILGFIKMFLEKFKKKTPDK